MPPFEAPVLSEDDAAAIYACSVPDETMDNILTGFTMVRSHVQLPGEAAFVFMGIALLPVTGPASDRSRALRQGAN
jgi:hypothetical protein